MRARRAILVLVTTDDQAAPHVPGGEGPTWARRAVAAAARRWVRHPRWSLAVKGAVAAALAWFVGVLAPEPFSDYPYYAPLGAVVATTSTLARSVRESTQAILAILVGAAIARGVDLVLSPSALSVAIVVGLALLCSGWRRFGEMGTWAVTSALFVLIIGNAAKVEFVGAYAGLVVVGAAIGVGINLLVPPLPLTPTEEALDGLRDTLVDQVEALADGLDGERPPSAEEWEERRREVAPTLARARDAVARTREAARANLRLRRHRDWAVSQVRRSHELDVSADVVGSLVRLLVEWEREGRDDLALGARLRPLAARALDAYAAALRSVGTEPADEEALRALAARAEDLRSAVREARQEDDEDYFVAGAVVLALRRGAAVLAAT
ncbi:aromatic acid exporter family protein [Cellulosimicrobium cellulans]|uniref:FUSC family protein n=1 Tax=Cellulosimicrobium cellulans TaxID=1710 RepID=UPI0036E1D5AA